MGDSAHAQLSSPESGEFVHASKTFVNLYHINTLSHEAVAYALYCVGREGLLTSLKPEEALIYLYDGRMVGLSCSWKHKDLPQAMAVDIRPYFVFFSLPFFREKIGLGSRLRLVSNH